SGRRHDVPCRCDKMPRAGHSMRARVEALLGRIVLLVMCSCVGFVACSGDDAATSTSGGGSGGATMGAGGSAGSSGSTGSDGASGAAADDGGNDASSEGAGGDATCGGPIPTT